jgi:hypothetical protein
MYGRGKGQAQMIPGWPYSFVAALEPGRSSWTAMLDAIRLGPAASAWDRLHPRLTHRGAWLGHRGKLPVIDGTLIRLQVDRLPGDRDPKPVWLWCSRTGATAEDVDRCWQAFLTTVLI